MAKSATEAAVLPLTLQLEPIINLSEDELCRVNRDLRVERTAKGELVILTPTGSEAGGRSSEINFQVAPDFVVELRSPSDDLHVLLTKMQGYLDNGTRKAGAASGPPCSSCT